MFKGCQRKFNRKFIFANPLKRNSQWRYIYMHSSYVSNFLYVCTSSLMLPFHKYWISVKYQALSFLTKTFTSSSLTSDLSDPMLRSNRTYLEISLQSVNSRFLVEKTCRRNRERPSIKKVIFYLKHTESEKARPEKKKDILITVVLFTSFVDIIATSVSRLKRQRHASQNS